MSTERQRWGVYAVDDHLDARRLIPELLLYDRLVFPYPTDGDRDRWRKKHWDPDLLDRRIEMLGPSLIETVPWDQEARGEWSRAYEQLKQDTHNLDPAVRERLGYVGTPYVLRMHLEPEPGVETVVSFPSLSHITNAWSLKLHLPSRNRPASGFVGNAPAMLAY